MDDFDYMREAISLAKIAAEYGEVPVGAVVVRDSDGAIIGRGYNRRELDASPTAHAELIAIEQAAKERGSWRLHGCTLYVTLEPCPMCAGGIINSRISRVVFGAYDEKAGSVSSVQSMFALPYNHKPAVTGGLLEDDCKAVLQAFFAALREKRNQNKTT